MPKAEEPTREAVAWHEAGHAVVALLLDRGVRTATIKPDEGVFGYVHPEPLTQDEVPMHTPIEPDDDDMRRSIEHRMMFTLGGPVAESRHTGRDALEHLEGNDLAHVDRMLTWLVGPDNSVRDAYVTVLLDRTGKLLWRSQSGLAAVATALLERTTLSGDEVAAAYWSGMDPSPNL